MKQWNDIAPIVLEYLSTENVLFSWTVHLFVVLNQIFTLSRFIRVGGYRLLNSWLTYSKTTNNTPLLQLILLTLQKLPLKVDHLKQVLMKFQPKTTVLQIINCSSNLHIVFCLQSEQHSKVGEAAEQECRDWGSVGFCATILKSFG